MINWSILEFYKLGHKPIPIGQHQSRSSWECSQGLFIDKLSSQIIIIKTGVSYPLRCLWYYRACGGGGLVPKSCLTLVTPWTVAQQAPLSMGFSRQEYWSVTGVLLENNPVFPSPRGSSQPRNRTWVSCLAGRFFTYYTTREVQRTWLILSLILILKTAKSDMVPSLFMQQYI